MSHLSLPDDHWPRLTKVRDETNVALGNAWQRFFPDSFQGISLPLPPTPAPN